MQSLETYLLVESGLGSALPVAGGWARQSATWVSFVRELSRERPKHKKKEASK